MTSSQSPRLDVHAPDGSRLVLVDVGDGRVEISLAQAPARSVSAVFSAASVDEVAGWLAGRGS